MALAPLPARVSQANMRQHGVTGLSRVPGAAGGTSSPAHLPASGPHFQINFLPRKGQCLFFGDTKLHVSGMTWEV